MAQINLVGKNILGYTVIEQLGAGAFGTVYKVVKKNAAGQYVRALKHITIPTEKQYNSVLNSMGGDISKADNYFSQMLNNIVSEIKILNELSESGVQNVVRYYENEIIVTDSPRRYDIFILMEYLTPLEDFIKNTDFTVRNVVRLGIDILNGLLCCHQNDVIHRDIKDDNIFVTDKGEFKIGDFGVSKVLTDSSKAESLKGTPNFLAPEVYLGRESYTKSVDLYSLGIVLYRLLNYGRNPFLPDFPKQYFSEDEDKAFEERMSGKIPALPLLGGELIGHAIIKSLLNSSERYQTAEEFKRDLEDAVNNTLADILDEKVNYSVSVKMKSNGDLRQKPYGATIGESIQSVTYGEDNEKNVSVNRYLFESIGENPSLDIPEIEPIIRTQQSDEYIKKADKTSTEKENERVIKNVPPTIKEVEEPTVLDKKAMGKFVCIIPMLLLSIGVIAYFIVIPNMYGKVVSFIDWLFTEPQNIIDTLSDPNAVLPQVNSIIGMRIFWWIWLVAFITSLFFVGKQLQAKPEQNTINAILTKKEPYLLMQDVVDLLKQIKVRNNNKQLESLMYAVKKLEEKLSVESDFGYGKDAVINCENNIAQQIQFLLEVSKHIEDGNFEENMNAMNMAVANINSLLRKRIELKKK